MLFNEYIAAARRAQARATDEERELGRWAVETYLREQKRQGIKPYEFKAMVRDED